MYKVDKNAQTGAYRKMPSAWNISLRQAKQRSAVKEYPAVRRVTTKTPRTALLKRSFGSSS